MKKTKLSFYFIFISIFTAIAFFVTIVQSSYNTLIKPMNQVKDNKISPIDSNLDFSVIDEIEKREDYPEDIPIIIVGNTASSSPTRVVSNPSTSSASIAASASGTATPSSSKNNSR
jgi:hypothetical protein